MQASAASTLLVAACACGEFDSPIAGAPALCGQDGAAFVAEPERALFVVSLEPLAALLRAGAAQQHAYLSAVLGAGDVRAAVAAVVADADAGAPSHLPGLHAVARCDAHVDVCSDACVVRVHGLPRSVCVDAGIEMRRNRWAGALLLACIHSGLWQQGVAVGCVVATKVVHFGVAAAGAPVAERPRDSVEVAAFSVSPALSHERRARLAAQLSFVMAALRSDVWNEPSAVVPCGAVPLSLEDALGSAEWAAAAADALPDDAAFVLFAPSHDTRVLQCELFHRSIALLVSRGTRVLETKRFRVPPLSAAERAAARNAEIELENTAMDILRSARGRCVV
jgi:hypothetical protein